MVTELDVKQFMSQAYYISKRVRTILEKIAEYKAKALKDTAAWSDTPRGGHSISSPQAVWIEKIIAEQEKLKDGATDLVEKEQLIRELIELLYDEKSKAILEDYHLYRLGMNKITIKYNFSDRQIFRILRKAYRDIAFKINDDPELEKRFRENMSVYVSN